VQEGPQNKPLEVRLFCPDLRRLDEAADDLKERLAGYQGVYDIEDELNAGKRELQVKLKPAARALGLMIDDMARQIRDGFYGGEAVRVQRGRDEITVRVRYPQEHRASVSDLENMRIRTPVGDEIPFHEAAELRLTRSYNMIAHQYAERRCRVMANVDNRVTNAEHILASLEADVLPELTAKHGVTYTFEGQHAQIVESLQSLTSGFVMAMIAVYAILAGMLGSYAQPLIIMAAVPMGFVGAVAGHWIMGYDLSLFSLFGVVALAGVVVNDSLVLLDQINKLVRRGVSVHEAVRRSGEARFRAVILTTITTVCGLLPLLSERSTQAQTLIPMAVSLAFGLIAATVLTLVVVPSLYLLVNDARRTARWLRHGGAYPPPESVEPNQGVPLGPKTA
jgi:multidrug efflux pump subunit AcrB